MAFKRNEAMKLAKMMFARGVLCNNTNGMIGRWALLSTQRQMGKQTPNMASDAIVNGCVPL
jgi:hypothetical protein